MDKVGRNEPCPCGSGKKYKQCCWGKLLGPRKIRATVMSQQPKSIDLMDRAFGDSIRQAAGETHPPVPPTAPPEKE